ncbi:hypothetical protein CAter10_2335 [Collimonas arenae]|nr:hypothetical protein CAter10_2335 [Collimonas arenae]
MRLWPIRLNSGLITVGVALHAIHRQQMAQLGRFGIEITRVERIPV